jgi:hypothetical protein
MYTMADLNYKNKFFKKPVQFSFIHAVFLSIHNAGWIKSNSNKVYRSTSHFMSEKEPARVDLNIQDEIFKTNKNI